MTATPNPSEETTKHLTRIAKTAAIMKKISLFCLFSLFTIIAMAQGKKSFTLDDLLPGGSTFRNLQPQNMYTTWWGDHCVETTLEGCYAVNRKNGSKEQLFTLEQLNGWLGCDMEHPAVRSCYYVSFPHPEKPWAAVQYTSEGKNGGPRRMNSTWVDFKKGTVVWTQDIPGHRHGHRPFRRIEEHGIHRRGKPVCNRC